METLSARERHAERLHSRLITVLFVLVIAGIALNIFTFYTLQGKIASLSSSSGSSQSASITFGDTLANIDQPFNSSALSVINNAPNSYFENAGQMLLAGNLSDMVEMQTPNTIINANAFTANGKPSVIYIGATSCVFCGENRWAMALALGRFGSFSKLYTGYSAIGDQDVPTIFWIADNYTTPAGVGYGNSYSSPYINFISSDYESPLTQGFQLPPQLLGYYVMHAPNSTYASALSYMNQTNAFSGTPFSLWGNVLFRGADGVVFGNTTPSGSSLPLTYMTHAQVLNQLKNFNDRFAWAEYAAADVYIADLCPSINNASSVCSLPAIKALEVHAGV